MAAPTITTTYEAHNESARTMRAIHQAWAVDVNLLAASDGTTNELVPAKTNHTIFVTHISVAITTDAAQTLTFQDDTGTPIVLAKTKSSPGIGPILFEFGEMGTPCGAGQAFDLNISAAGLAGRIHAEGYYKRTAVAAA